MVDAYGEIGHASGQPTPRATLQQSLRWQCDSSGNVYAYNGLVSVGTISIADVETAYAQVGLGFVAYSQIYLYQVWL